MLVHRCPRVRSNFLYPAVVRRESEGEREEGLSQREGRRAEYRKRSARTIKKVGRTCIRRVAHLVKFASLDRHLEHEERGRGARAVRSKGSLDARHVETGPNLSSLTFLPHRHSLNTKKEKTQEGTQLDHEARVGPHVAPEPARALTQQQHHERVLVLFLTSRQSYRPSILASSTHRSTIPVSTSLLSFSTLSC